MRKSIKYLPILTSVLCAIFMFSVGFSSWLILLPVSPVSTVGHFTSYPYTEHIVVENVDVFEFETTHFVEYEDGEKKPTPEFGDDNYGYIKVQYSFTDAAKAYAVKQGGYNAEISLFYENAKPDSDGTQPSLFKPTNIEARVNGTGTVYTPTEQTDRFSFVYSFGADLPDGFTVIYRFKTKAGLDFRNDFGKYLVLGNGDTPSTVFLTSAREVSS